MTRADWLRYAKLFRGSYSWLLVSICASIGQAFFILPVLLLIRFAFNSAMPGGNLRLLLWVGAALFALTVGGDAFALAARTATLTMTKAAIRRLREELLLRVYTLSPGYYAGVDRAALHAVIVHDSERVDAMSSALFAVLLPAAIACIILGVVLFVLNPLLFVVTTATVPLFVFLNVKLRGQLTACINAYHQSFAVFDKGIAFALQRLDLVRVQATEQSEIDRQRRHIGDLQITSRQLAWSSAIYVSTQNMVVTTASIIMLVAGAALTATGKLRLVEFLAFYVMATLLRAQLSAVLSVIPQIIAGTSAWQALCRILDLHDRVPYTGSAQIAFRGGIALRSVDFQYNTAVILRSVDLTITPGTTTAITGTNGAGKTTIVNLMLGLYRPQGGHLYADEHPFDALDLVHLRRQIGVVPQAPIIFFGTVAENIGYGCAGASRADIREVAQLAGADRFIEQLPQGYDTLVGEDGAQLSGGQRQRLAVARAFLGRPPLLLLDEPANHLDDEGVHTLLCDLRATNPRQTILVISHNRELVRGADVVYHLSEGRLTKVEPAVVG